MLMSVMSICVLVHILINIQKIVAFQKIENSVSTHLDVDKENSQQVCGNIIHSFTANPEKLMMTTVVA